MQQVDAQALWQKLGPTYFCNLSTFGALPDHVVLGLLSGGRVLHLNAGEVLYKLGERTESFFIVIKGSINNYVPGVEGDLVLSRHHEPGDDMGFVHMISLNNRTATAIAEEDLIIVELSTDQFFMLHELEPDAFGIMLLNLTRGMARTIITMAGMLADLDKQLHAISCSTHQPLGKTPQ